MEKQIHLTTWGKFLLAAIYLYLVLVVGGDMCGSVVTAVDGDDRDALVGKIVSAFRRTCRTTTKNNTPEEFEDLENSNCSFSSETRTRQFILRPISGFFLLKFEIKAIRNAMISLASERKNSSIFAEIGLGSGSNGIVAFIRPCNFDKNPEACEGNVAKFTDDGSTLSETEARPFWVEYIGGVLTVGKGGQEAGLMVWDAGEYHGHLPSVVHVTIASLVRAEWLFHGFCE